MSLSLSFIIWAVELVGLLLMNNIPRKLDTMGSATAGNVAWLVVVNAVNTLISAAITYEIVQVAARILTGHTI
jgi:hypothetical protein